MNGQDPLLTYTLAGLRGADLLAEAEAFRMTQPRRGRRGFAAALATLRRHAGALVVRAGERIQGSRVDRPLPGDLFPTGAALRVAR